MFTRSLVILALALTTGSSAMALQPQNHSGDDATIATKEQAKNQAEKQAKKQDPEALRKRLLHTLEFAKRVVEKHESALAQLDAGDDPRQVMKSLRTPEFRRFVRTTMKSASVANDQDSSGTRRKPSASNITPQELKAVRRFITKHLGQIDSQLNYIEQLHPNSTKPLVIRLAPKILEIIRINDQDPEFAALKLEDLKAGLLFLDASRMYHAQLRPGKADESALKQAEQNLYDAATVRFDVQVKIKQYEIDLLQARVENLRTALDDLGKQRDEQVNAQVQAARTLPKRRAQRQLQQQRALQNKQERATFQTISVDNNTDQDPDQDPGDD